jgi:hypothetical protein
MAAKTPRRIVAAYDDDRFVGLLAEWGDALARHRRPGELSRPGVTTLDVLAEAARSFDGAGNGPDYLLLMEITHPLRPKGIVDELIAVAAADRPDSLITCRPAHYNYWHRADDGPTTRIVGANEPNAGALFQEMIGIGSVFRKETLLSDNRFGDRVDMAPIDRFWATIDVRDPDGLWLAEKYLERIDTEL